MGGAWLYKEGVIETAPGMPEPKNLDEELKAEEEEGEKETSDNKEQVEAKNSESE